MQVLFSPAKLNLFLEVVSRRDDGYHDIETIFARISLYDVIYADLQPGRGDVFIEMTGGPNIPLNKNLCYRIAKLYLQLAGISHIDVSIQIHKYIPAGAGLGGGSGNAATILKWLNTYFRKFDDQELRNIAKQVGCDVPFFLLEKPWAVGKGRGELLKSLNNFPKAKFIVVFPGIEIPTGKIYSGLKLTYQPVSVKISTSIENFEDFCFNRLLEVVERFYPQVKEMRHLLSRTAGCKFFLTGSGGALFAPYKDEDKVNWESLLCLVKDKGWHLWCVESV